MLTSKQIEFCNRYIANPQCTKDCAEGLWKQPGVAASRQLAKPEIQEYIKMLNKKVDKSNILSITQMQEMLTKIVIGVEGEKVLRVDKDTGLPVEVMVPANLQTKLKALELLGKSSAMFIDKVETTNVTEIVVSIIEDEDDE